MQIEIDGKVLHEVIRAMADSDDCPKQIKDAVAGVVNERAGQQVERLRKDVDTLRTERKELLARCAMAKEADRDTIIQLLEANKRCREALRDVNTAAIKPTLVERLKGLWPKAIHWHGGREPVAVANEEFVELLHKTGPEPDDDGWIEWNGGNCPVDGDTRVEVELRDGGSGIRNEDCWDWTHNPRIPACDIVRYRIAKEQA